MIARPLVAVLVGVRRVPQRGGRRQPLPATSIVKRLNAERSRLGLPARVAEVPDWSARCTAHNRWMSANAIAHDEPPGTEGYSEAGDWAGIEQRPGPGHELARGQPVDRRAAAPHRSSSTPTCAAWAPRTRSARAASRPGPGCAAGTARRIWTVPRAGGQVPASQQAWEAPFTPQERVGIAADDGHGPVPLRVVGRVRASSSTAG